MWRAEFIVQMLDCKIIAPINYRSSEHPSNHKRRLDDIFKENFEKTFTYDGHHVIHRNFSFEDKVITYLTSLNRYIQAIDIGGGFHGVGRSLSVDFDIDFVSVSLHKYPTEKVKPEKLQSEVWDLNKMKDGLKERKFDYITSYMTFRHLHDPVESIRILIQSLKMNGILIVEGYDPSLADNSDVKTLYESNNHFFNNDFPILYGLIFQSLRDLEEQGIICFFVYSHATGLGTSNILVVTKIKEDTVLKESKYVEVVQPDFEPIDQKNDNASKIQCTYKIKKDVPPVKEWYRRRIGLPHASKRSRGSDESVLTFSFLLSVKWVEYFANIVVDCHLGTLLKTTYDQKTRLFSRYIYDQETRMFTLSKSEMVENDEA